jgi:carboxyl-terminal processing protease
MKHRKLVLVAAIMAVALVSGGWLLQHEAEPVGSVYRQARLFEDVLAHVADYYVDSIDERQLYQMAIDGLLDRLHDPYSVFLKRDDFRALSEATSGNYGGLGIQIDVRDGWITVIAPLPDTPADRAGIMSGDQVVALDGRSTEGWKNDQAVKELRGQPGSSVELQVRRVGVEQPLTFKITRATIHIHSVYVSQMLDDKVGFIALSPVSETSASELTTAILELTKKGMKSLILDLRGNPGGLLDQGIAVSDLFLDPGQEVVETRGRTPSSSRLFRDSKAQEWPGLPIVVLVNGGSASAAEIIAGALQDHDRALLVGAPTFGKGLVQSLWQLTPETALKLTTARWYTPSGRTIQRKSKNEADQEAQVALAEQGRDTTQPDTTQLFHTDNGRVEYGGGGIRPDLFVPADTLSTPERAFVKALGNKITVYRDVLSSYSLELKGSGRLKDPAFVVTEDMVRTVMARLRTRGVDVADDVAVKGAQTLIARELGYEAVQYAFGRTAEFRRRMADDRQIREGLALARRAKSPQDLLALGTAHPAASPRN